MPTWAYVIVGLVGFPASLAGAVALLRRLPGETRKLTVDTVDVNVKIAGELRDDAVSDRQQAREELAALRAEFNQYRTDTDARLIELGTQLRGEKAENRRLTADLQRRDDAIAERDERIDRLQERVEELESEVRELKANGHQPAP